MIRLAVFVLVATSLIAAISGVPPLVILILILLLVVAAFTFGGHRLRCPKCGKRIRLGYTVCSGCGADTRDAARASDG